MSGNRRQAKRGSKEAAQQVKDEMKPTLPADLKIGLEALSGFSMDGVHVHRNSAKPTVLDALAPEQGSNMQLASGQEGLPHEAWPVVQQLQHRGQPIDDDASLEAEADQMGERAERQANIAKPASR
jgi:hypothetical protein